MGKEFNNPEKSIKTMCLTRWRPDIRAICLERQSVLSSMPSRKQIRNATGCFYERFCLIKLLLRDLAPALMPDSRRWLSPFLLPFCFQQRN